MLSPLPLPAAPRDLAPADVPAVGLPLERDQLARVGTLLRGVRHGVAQPRHREHAPAVHPQRAVGGGVAVGARVRSEEHTSELQSQSNLVCRLLLEKKKTHNYNDAHAM